MISMQDRTAVVFGVANKRSIAWSIAQKLHQAGAKLVLKTAFDEETMRALFPQNYAARL